MATADKSTAGFSDDGLGVYMAELSRHTVLSREEEAHLARRWQELGSPRDSARLVQGNLRFVVKVAMGYRKFGFELEDLIQEGNMGLLRAVDRFDPDRGVRLISFGVWWIRASIQEYILRNWSVVRIGTTQTQRKIFNWLTSSQRRLEWLKDLDNADAQRAAIAVRAGTTVEEVLEIEARVRNRSTSLDAPGRSGDRDGPSLGDQLPDGGEGPEDSVLRRHVSARTRAALQEAMGDLDPRRRAILEARYLQDERSTLSELAEVWGVTKERIRQLEISTVKRLRKALVPLQRAS
jgi:RNA polymerase sigma-32 factor